MTPPRIVPRAEWGADPPKPAIEKQKYPAPLPDIVDHVVIHHTGFSEAAPPTQIQQYALRSGWDDIAYHYYIGGDGKIYEGRPLQYVGGHAGQSVEANDAHDIRKDPDYGSIGIALAGYFPDEHQVATRAQLESLSWLVDHLRSQFPKISPDHILLHREVDEAITGERGYTPYRDGGATDCPGNGVAGQVQQLRTKLGATLPAPDPTSVEEGTLTDADDEKNLPPLERMRIYGSAEMKKILENPESDAAQLLILLVVNAPSYEDIDSLGSFLTKLVGWGVLTDLEAFGEEGLPLVELSRKTKGGLGEIFTIVSSLIESGTITPEELRAAYGKKTGWLRDLAVAIGQVKQDPEVREYFGYRIASLAGKGIFRGKNLDDLFQFKRGHLLPELIAVTWNGANRSFSTSLDYWAGSGHLSGLDGHGLGEAIHDLNLAQTELNRADRRLNDDTEKKIGISHLGPPFYEAVERFQSLLPMDDMPKLLSLLAKLVNNPSDLSLLAFINQKKGIDLLHPETAAQVETGRAYAALLEHLFSGSWVSSWYDWYGRNVSLVRLTENYRGKSPEEIFDVVCALGPGGEKWLRESGYEAPAFPGASASREIAVNRNSLKEIYARFYMIRVLKPDEAGQYRFVWQDDGVSSFNLADYAEFVSRQNWLAEFIGEQGAVDVIKTVGFERLRLDGKGPDVNLLGARDLEKIRSRLNEASLSPRVDGGRESGRVLAGDLFVNYYVEGLCGLLIVGDNDSRARDRQKYIAVSKRTEIFLDWDQYFRTIAHENADSIGPAMTLVSYLAGGLRNYFDSHREEFLARNDWETIREELLKFERPLWLDRKGDPADALEEFLQARRIKK